MEKTKSYLKDLFVCYWEFLLVQKACKYNLFDYIAQGIDTLDELVLKLQFNKKILKTFLNALIIKGFLIKKHNRFLLTEKSKLLIDGNKDTLKNACILWGEEQFLAWQKLDITLKTGKSAFESLYGKSFFDFISQDYDKLLNYHKALAEYARDDYRNLVEIHDFSLHKKVIDVGGGFGILGKYLKNKYSNIDVYVLDKKEVVELAQKYCKYTKQKINFISGDFFYSIPQADAIVLSKVLHDWDDANCIKILKNCHISLEKNGTLYIIEIDASRVNVSMLSLNMSLICKSYERSLAQYVKLLNKTNFAFCESKNINELYSLIIAKKKNEMA